MANAWYNKGLEGFALGEIDWDTAVIKVAAVRLTAAGAPTFTASQKFMSELLATHTIAGTPGILPSRSALDGILDAGDMTNAFGDVPANGQSHVLVIYQASAVTGGSDVANTAQRLIMWIDTGTNLPFTTNGGQINITWDNGANKIGRL